MGTRLSSAYFYTNNQAFPDGEECGLLSIIDNLEITFVPA